MANTNLPGRVQAPELNFNPTLQPGPLVSGVAVQPVNNSGAGSNLLKIADTLQSLGAPLSQFNQVVTAGQVEQQSQQIDLMVAKIEAGFGTQATAADISNVTSALHPKVAQRVTEDYMFNVGNEWVRAQLEAMPHDAIMSPEAEAAFYANLRSEALKTAGNDPLRAAGFMKAVQSQIEQSSQQTSASRRAEWTKVQSDAFSNGISAEADKIANASLIPQLSSAITSTAEKYNAPWLVPFLSRTAQIESGGGRVTSNTQGSGAAGPFQFMPGTAKAYGLADPYDVNTSTDAAARLAMDNYVTLKAGLGREPTMGELYLAHQQGAGGALSLLKNPEGDATGTVGMKAVTMNGGSAGMTNAEFAGIWTKKFGDGNTMPTNMDQAQVIPPEALALRSYFFGADAEYKATGSLGNAERRDIAADTFLQKAIQYRDERFLLAMPEELMTPAIRDAYSKAREQIGNMIVSDLRDQEFMRDVREKQTIRDTTFDVINRRASGEQVDPYQIAVGPDGKLDPVKLAAAQAAVANGGNMLSDTQSKREAAKLRDTMRDAFLKSDFSAIPMLNYSGDQPTADDLRTAIMNNPALNDQEKIALYKSVDQDLGTVAFLQSPQVEKHFANYVTPSLDSVLRNEILAADLMSNGVDISVIEERVRDAFDASLLFQIEAAGGVPVDMRAMLKEATSDAQDVINNLAGATLASATARNTTPPPTSQVPNGHFEDQNGKRVWVPD